jgi:predicted transcriptional regulator
MINIIKINNEEIYLKGLKYYTYNMSEKTVEVQTNEQTNETTTPQAKLVDIVVKDEVMALNLIVSFLNLAQRRGAFSLDESAKLWECIKMFQKPE